MFNSDWSSTVNVFICKWLSWARFTIGICNCNPTRERIQAIGKLFWNNLAAQYLRCHSNVRVITDSIWLMVPIISRQRAWKHIFEKKGSLGQRSNSRGPSFSRGRVKTGEFMRAHDFSTTLHFLFVSAVVVQCSCRGKVELYLGWYQPR